MKILVYQWKAYSTRYLIMNLRRMQIRVTEWADQGIQEEEETAIIKLEHELGKNYDAVMSYNYFKGIALACHDMKVKYISWTQDSPMLSLYDETACLDTNYFFCFDSEQLQRLLKRGIGNAYYCPLAVDTMALWNVAIGHREPMERYISQISFVGSLYSERNMLSELPIAEYLKGYFEGIVKTQLLLPAVRFSQMQIAPTVDKMVQESIVFEGLDKYQINSVELIDNLIDRQVTVEERRKMLQIFPEEIDFKLYTNSDTSKWPLIKNMGTVDYYTEMPIVFKNSLVNLNVSLRSIRKGIPLRILDVMSSGGFLLTNTQEGLFLFFEEGKDIVTFSCLEEMKDKALYYLKHDTERMQITEKGLNKTRKYFDFSVLLPQILQVAGLIK